MGNYQTIKIKRT